jgi:hypothetical protein
MIFLNDIFKERVGHMSWLKVEQKTSSQVVQAEYSIAPSEVMAFCPACKAFQTVWFTNGTLNPTRKFTQNGNHIYHDCGSGEPCSLYVSV